MGKTTKGLAAGAAEIARRIEPAKRLLLVVDFDTTLAELGDVPAPLRVWLEEFADPVREVAVIGEVGVAELEARVGIRGLVYAANHGMQARGRGLRYVEPLAYLGEPTMRRVAAELAETLRGCKRLAVEDHGLSVRIRLGEAPEQDRQAAAKAILVQLGQERQFRFLAGREGFDILPGNGWNRAAAVGRILEGLGMEGAQVVYAGGGEADEEAFRSLEGAVTVKVGAGLTEAEYIAGSATELWALLPRLLAAARSPANVPRDSGARVPRAGASAAQTG